VLEGIYPWVVATALLHGITLLVSGGALILKRRNLAWAGVAAYAATFLVNTAMIALLWVRAERPPFKTLFETLIFYPWCVAAVTLVLIGLHRLFVLVPFAALASLVGLAYALVRPDVEIVSLPPALQSGWFVPHVVTYFVAYAGLFASFVLAVLALLEPFWAGRRGAESGSPEGLARYAHQACVFGVTALTLGLVMGAVWGKFAWGDYWSWDPKENWALVTWLAYLAYLHIRLTPAWRGRRAMWLLVFSFGAVVFTYLGMNLLPSAEKSLHVYQ